MNADHLARLARLALEAQDRAARLARIAADRTACGLVFTAPEFQEMAAVAYAQARDYVRLLQACDANQ